MRLLFSLALSLNIFCFTSLGQADGDCCIQTEELAVAWCFEEFVATLNDYQVQCEEELL